MATMTLSQRARRWLSSLAKSLQFPIARRGIMSTWQQPNLTNYGFDRLANEGYRLNSAVNTCVNKLQMGYLQAPIAVRDSAGNMAKTDESPMLALLKKPNELMSWHELAKYIECYKAIGGACRLHKVRDDRTGAILELWPYHIGQIRAVPGEKNWIEKYQFTGSGDPDKTENQIDRADIIDLGWPSVDPLAPWQPLAPIIACAREVDTDSEATRYQYALLYNDAVPLTVLKFKRKLVDGQFERYQAQFSVRHGGGNRGRIAVLEEDAEIERMGLNLEELAFEAMRHVPEARIAASFAVPAMYSGLNVGLQQSTYNNMSEARTAFFQDTIVPQSMLDDGELTQSLADEYPGDYYVSRDWSQVPALQESSDSIYKRELDAFKATITNRNEARRRMGLQSVEDIKLAPGVPAYPPGFGDSFYLPPAPVIPAELLEAPKDRGLELLAKILQAKAGSGRERAIQRDVRRYLLEQYDKAADQIGAMDD